MKDFQAHASSLYQVGLESATRSIATGIGGYNHPYLNESLRSEGGVCKAI